MPEPAQELAIPDWAIVVHGGAKRIAPELAARNRQGCLAATSAGAAVLRQGGTALDAAEAAVRVLEDDPVFNAGYGSVLNRDGDVEMDAAIMDGATLRIGAVGAVRRLRNPVSLARALLDEVPVLLVAGGAEQFAAEHGIALCDPAEMISAERLASERAKAHDTVGCVAVDRDGRVAAATSTGGLPGKFPGRVGDSPLPGCGYYADDALGGVAFSGDGESIMRTMLAARAMQALAASDPQAVGDVQARAQAESGAQAAAAAAIAGLGRVGGEAGIIVIGRDRRIGIAYNSDHFATGLQTSAMDAPEASI